MERDDSAKLREPGKASRTRDSLNARVAAPATPDKAEPETQAPRSTDVLPHVALPTGGGAIRGIGEKFAVNAANGTAGLTVPLALSPGRSGFTPQLSLSYDSGAGNGPFGFGWSLSLPSVTRKTDKGLPRYLDCDESDVFILSGAEDLMPAIDSTGAPMRTLRTLHDTDYQVTTYRPRTEGLFARIERWYAIATGVSHWRSISRDNVTTLYGLDPSSCIADPDDATKICTYRISCTWDDKGNMAVYDYTVDDGAGIDLTQAHEANRTAAIRGTQRYLWRVRYGNAQPFVPDWGQGGADAWIPEYVVVLRYRL